MDHHCPWLNNCIAHANTKYFIQFLLYLFLTSLCQVYLSVKTVLNLVKHPHVKPIIYANEFQKACAGGTLVFLLSAFAAYVTFELLREQYVTIEENQGYVDELKKQFGKQQAMWTNLKLAFGEDFLWWLVPTRPELRTNYLERVWPKRQVKQMYIAG